MAVLPLRYVPDPVLRQKARRVRAIDRSVGKLVDDMLETMHAASGVGLAAPQVGVPLRVAVIQLPEQEEVVLINPQILRRTGERVVTEGCLSIPGYAGEIPRAEKVRVRALDRHGREFRLRAEDLLAQALEHELDHLNGVLYVDHLDSLDDLRKLEPPQAEETSEPVARE